MTRISNRQAVAPMSALQPFETHNGTLAGRVYGARGCPGVHLPSGWLSDENRARLREATVVYLVLSYGTPIGWVTDTGERAIPDARYSVTTSRHQGLIRFAWRESEAVA